MTRPTSQSSGSTRVDPGSPRRAAATLGLLGSMTALVGTLWFLDRVGDGVLAPPSSPSVDATRTWAESRDVAEIVMATLRLLAIGLTWYLLALIALGALARLARVRRVVGALDRATPAWVRTILDSSVGVGLVAAATLGMLAPAGDTTPNAESASAGHVTADGDDASVATMTVLDGAAATMHPIDAAGPTDATMVALDPEPEAPVASTPVDADVWVIESGDHLWRVAEETLSHHAGRPVSDREVDGYWRTLIELNRDVLSDPTNPDLVYPGQVFTLPPAP